MGQQTLLPLLACNLQGCNAILKAQPRTSQQILRKLWNKSFSLWESAAVWPRRATAFSHGNIIHQGIRLLQHHKLANHFYLQEHGVGR